MPKVNRLISFQNLFILLCVANALPVLAFQIFPTNDGPAHIYNANILQHLLLDNESLFQDFFKLNTQLVPNYSSQGLMLTGMSIGLSSVLMAQVINLICVIGLPLSLYFLMKHIKPENTPLAILSLPFSYTLFFSFGFFNFQLGVISMLLTINYWLKVQEQFTLLNFASLFAFVGLTYFSHPMPFGVLVMAILVLTIQKWFKKPERHLWFYGLAFLPYLFLLGLFWAQSPKEEGIHHSTTTLVEWLATIKPLEMFGLVEEKQFSPILSVLFGLLIIIGLVNKKRREATPWLIISILVLLLYFVLPAATAGGGFVSERLNSLFFIFLLLGIGAMQMPRWLQYVSGLVVLSFSFYINTNYYSYAQRLDADAKGMIEAEKHVPNESVVLPVRLSDNWLDLHLSNYLGYRNQVVVLENYEASQGHFPTLWNSGQLPRLSLGNIDQGCLNYANDVYGQERIKLDYIIVWGHQKPNDCQKEILAYAETNFKRVKLDTKGDIWLYQAL